MVRQTSILIWMLASLLLGACMVSPHDGTIVKSKTAPLDFRGMVISETARVDIKAFNFQTQEWDVITTTTVNPEDKPYAMEYSNMTWYLWKTEAVLGEAYWEAGAQGYKASVMASAGGNFFMSGREDMIDCFSTYKDEGPETVYSKCQAPYSPAARIQTIDYQPASSEPSVQITGGIDPWRDGDLPPFPQPCKTDTNTSCFGVVLWCFYERKCVNPQLDDEWSEGCGACLGIDDVAFKWPFW